MSMLSRDVRTVNVDGKPFPVRASTAVCMMMLELLEDELLTPEQKALMLLKLFYRKPVPPRLREQALLNAIAFLRGENGPEQRSAQEPPLFSITKDFPVICASFLQAYGVHPLWDNLCWQDFFSLLGCLPPECPLGVFIARRQEHPQPQPQDRAMLEYLRSLNESETAS